MPDPTAPIPRRSEPFTLELTTEEYEDLELMVCHYRAATAWAENPNSNIFQNEMRDYPSNVEAVKRRRALAERIKQLPLSGGSL